MRITIPIQRIKPNPSPVPTTALLALPFYSNSPAHFPPDSVNVWLVSFDAEDNGRIAGWDWILGSREFVANNPIQPQAVVIMDMIGDEDLNIYKEQNSDPALTDEIWAVAGSLGYGDRFIPEDKHSLIDDHLPFIEAGVQNIGQFYSIFATR